MNIDQLSENLPDLTEQRLSSLEHRMQDMLLEVNHLQDMLRDTHRFIIQLGKNQAYLAQRVSQWPFIRVDSSSSEE